MIEKPTSPLSLALALTLVVACTAARHPSGVSTVQEARAKNLPIFITRLETTRPYQGGLVDVSIDYVNISGKSIRSVRFTLVAKDVKGASLPSETNNRFKAVLENSATVAPGDDGGSHWNAVWQNRRIVCSEILETDVEFSDGTTAVTYADSTRRACR